MRRRRVLTLNKVPAVVAGGHREDLDAVCVRHRRILPEDDGDRIPAVREVREQRAVNEHLSLEQRCAAVTHDVLADRKKRKESHTLWNILASFFVKLFC